MCQDLAASLGQNNCLRCTALADGKCSQFKNGFRLHFPTTLTSSCSTQCPQKTFTKKLINTEGVSYLQCVPCPPSCAECTNETTCTKCDSPLKISSNDFSQCIPCDTTSMTLFTEKEICYNCHASCKTCFGRTESTCLKCNSPDKLSIRSECLAPPKNPIVVTEAKFFEKSSQVLVTFGKNYKSADIKKAFKSVLIQPSENKAVSGPDQPVWNNTYQGYEKKFSVASAVNVADGKSFTLTLKIREKIEGGILHLINQSRDFLDYINSEQRLKDILAADKTKAPNLDL